MSAHVLFGAASIGMIVVGLIHAAANVGRVRPGSEAAVEAMRAFTVTALGLTWSIKDAYDALSLSYSWMSLWAGAAGLVLLRALRPQASGLRTLALVFCAGAVGLTAIAAAHRVSPPIPLYGLVAALFAVAAARVR